MVVVGGTVVVVVVVEVVVVEEVGVVFRGDNMKPMIAIPLEHFLLMLKIVTEE